MGVTWVDWASLVGVGATLAGLALTWQQARAAKKSADEARDASEQVQQAIGMTQRQLRANQLFVLIPQLRWITAQLDIAIADNDAARTRGQLDNWRWQAQHIHGILAAEDDSQKKLLKTVQESVALASSAGSSLLQGKLPVIDSCMQARESISDACHKLIGWAGEHSSTALRGEE